MPMIPISWKLLPPSPLTSIGPVVTHLWKSVSIVKLYHYLHKHLQSKPCKHS
jgi:hypothetical protein